MEADIRLWVVLVLAWELPVVLMPCMIRLERWDRPLNASSATSAHAHSPSVLEQRAEKRLRGDVPQWCGCV